MSHNRAHKGDTAASVVQKCSREQWWSLFLVAMPPKKSHVLKTAWKGHSLQMIVMSGASHLTGAFSGVMSVMFCFFCFFCVFVDVKRPYYYYYCCCCCCYYYYVLLLLLLLLLLPFILLQNPPYTYTTLQPYKHEVVMRICKLICARAWHCIAINPRLPFQLTAQAISQNSFIESFVKRLHNKNILITILVNTVVF